jgi:hypothetical protein
VLADLRIEYSDYVIPICLPFKPIDDVDALENDFVNLAGWGVNPQGKITNQVCNIHLRKGYLIRQLLTLHYVD